MQVALIPSYFDSIGTLVSLCSGQHGLCQQKETGQNKIVLVQQTRYMNMEMLPIFTHEYVLANLACSREREQAKACWLV